MAMNFEYKPSKRKSDYQVSGVITEVYREHILSANGTDEVPFGFVLTTLDRIPTKMYFKIKQNTIDNAVLIELKQVTVNFWIECREYNGKWYSSLCTNEVELYKE